MDSFPAALMVDRNVLTGIGDVPAHGSRRALGSSVVAGVWEGEGGSFGKAAWAGDHKAWRARREGGGTRQEVRGSEPSSGSLLGIYFLPTAGLPRVPARLLGVAMLQPEGPLGELGRV